MLKNSEGGEIMEQETMLKEILNALKLHSDHMDRKFQKVDERLQQIDERFDRIEGRLDRIEGRLEE